MADKVNTSTLMKRIFKANDLDAFMQNHENNMQPADFCTMLEELCESKGLPAARVIERAQIERTYGHQLFNGTRRPSRDKVLQLAIGLGLSVDETQKLLRAAGKSQLYPRLKRDAVILFALQHEYSMLTVQDTLTHYGLTLLGGQKNERE